MGVEVGWEHQTFRWKLVQGFRSWQRQEDLPLGPNWRITTGLSLPALGGDRTRVRYRAALDLGRWRERTYMWTNAELAGRYEDGGVANAVAHLELGGATIGKSGLRLRAAADIGHDLDRDRQLTLGADTGLRGYDPDTFDGTSRVVANVEWRRQITGEFLHVAVLGVTAFADGGKTWGARVGPSTEGWRGDAGVGLLLEITRASAVRILRFEIAYPDHGSDPVFQITTQSLF
jgi:hemolysin activation/secretion protein